jgi:hypothetical protein
VDVFDTAYYSGLDVGIYADNIYLGEAINLQYQVVENNIPYYGYASYTWQRVAKGTRMIQGSFTINFKEDFYIAKLLRVLRLREQAIASGPPKGASAQSMPTMQQALQGNVSLDNYLAMAGGNQPGQQLGAYHAVASAFEQALWGKGNPLGSGLTSNTHAPLFYAGPNGFTIYLRYGQPIGAPPTMLPTQNVINPLGGVQPVPQVKGASVGAIERIVGVEIVGVGKMIDDSGRPVTEVYNFMAKDLNEANMTGY